MGERLLHHHIGDMEMWVEAGDDNSGWLYVKRNNLMHIRDWFPSIEQAKDKLFHWHNAARLELQEQRENAREIYRTFFSKNKNHKKHNRLKDGTRPVIPEFIRKCLTIDKQYYMLVHAYSTDIFWHIELWDGLNEKCLLILRHEIEYHDDEEVAFVANEYRDNILVLSAIRDNKDAEQPINYDI